MIIDKEKFNDRNGYLESRGEGLDPETAKSAVEYKRKVAGRFSSITPEEIDYRLKGENLFVSRKLDGELAVVFYEKGTAVAINSGGTQRIGLPPVEEAAKALKTAGITSAVFAAELYVEETGGRTRVFDVLSALADKKSVERLRLAVFDIVSIDEKPYNMETYDKVLAKIKELFSGDNVKPVETVETDSKKELKSLYQKWVVTENAEGIVVRSEMPQVYKIKTKHTVDAAVIGFTEKSGEPVPVFDSLLLALKREENTFQVIGKAAKGLSATAQGELYQKLKEMVVESDHIETNSKRVAYRMVKPEVVIELGLHDILVETSKGDIKNTLLTYENDRYRFLSVTPGVSIIHPVIERVREDKTPTLANLRFAQVTDLVYISGLKKEIEPMNLKESEVLFREVYTKKSKGETMVQKFVVWKTNKEEVSDRHLAYVMHYTNYSPGRKDMLKRDVRISNDEEQIMGIVKQFIEKNIKKGWEKV